MEFSERTEGLNVRSLNRRANATNHDDRVAHEDFPTSRTLVSMDCEMVGGLALDRDSVTAFFDRQVHERFCAANAVDRRQFVSQEVS